MKVRALHIILLLLVACRIGFSANGLNFTIVESTDRYMVIDVRFDSVSFIQKFDNGVWATQVNLPGAGKITIPGQPQLPMTSLMLGIPADSRPTLSFISENSKTRNIGHVPVSPDDEQPAMISLPPASQHWYPESFAKQGVDAFVRDQRLFQVQLFPVRYQAATQLAQVAASLRLRIDFGEHAGASGGMGAGVDVFEPVYKSLVDNYESSKKWRQAQVAQPSLAKSGAAAAGTVRLYLQQAGVYSLSGRDLAQAGVDISSIYPRTLSLANKGRVVPIIVEGKSDGSFDIDDRIIFLGEHNRGDHTFLSFYSDINVYVLTWGATPGFAFSEMLAAPNGDESDTLETAENTIHFEKDLRYERLVGYAGGEDDHWFWDKIMDNQAFSTTVALPGLTPASSLILTAKFHGLTESADVDMNHHVVAIINGQKVAEGFGSNKKQFSLHSGRFTPNVFQPKLEVNFELPLDVPNVLIDHAFLNWFEIDYTKSLTAEGDRLDFQADPGADKLWRIGGFSTDQVYILTDNGYRLVNPKMNSTTRGYQFEFVYSSSKSAAIHVVGENALQKVQRIEIDKPSDLQNPANGADYIIITHKDFQQAAQQLADYHHDNGMRTMIVDIRDVYDEFSDGVYDPRAVKRFIAYAFQNWQRPAPAYILLFGDTTYLMHKTPAENAKFRSFIPSFMVNTKSYGMTSSDNYFACVSGDDDLPDIFIGRLPANNADEAAAMVEKIISYETKDVAAEWRRHITLAAGSGEFFDYSAQYLTDHYLPKWLSTHRLSTEFQSPHFNTTENFINWINSGQNIIDFLVHGSGEQIADANLLNKDDIIRLTNKDKYSFAVTMSCYIGHFDSPDIAALGEALLVAKDKGVMALFGSSGKSYSYSDFYFNGAVFDGIFNKGWRSLGEITTKAKYELIRKTLGYWEPVDNFLLLGDPAANLRLPQDEITLALSKKVLVQGETLTVSGALPQSRSGSLTLSVLSESDSVLAEKQVELQSDHFSTPLFTLTPETRQKWDAGGGPGSVQAYFTDGHYDAVGLASFSVVRPLVSEFVLSPSKPVGFQPFTFKAEISADVATEVGGIQSLIVKWSKDKRNWSDLALSQQQGSIWTSSDSLSLEEGTTLWYKLVISAGNGTVSEAPVQEYRVLYKPDVYWSTDVRYSGNGPSLLLTVKNRGESDAHNVAVRVLNKTSGVALVDGLLLPTVKARRDTTSALPIPALSPGSYELELTLDPQNVLPEEEEENNVLLKMLHIATPELGSNGTFDYSGQNVSAAVPAGAVAQTTSIELTTVQDEELSRVAENSSLVVLPMKGQSSGRMFSFLCSDSAVCLQKSPTIFMTVDPSDSLTAVFLAAGGARIFAWDARSAIWKAQETARTGDVLSADLPAQSKIFALMGSIDAEPPQVQIAIPGQNFADGDVVPKSPTFTIAVEDAGGIDVSPEHLTLSVDGTPLQQTDYVIVYDPQKSGDVKITYNSDIDRDEHQLQVDVRDVNGNAASQQVRFRIAEEFGLDFVANHPNPFEHETTLAFQISDMASSVKLNIYTVSGRLIRTFEFADISGYNEVDWDGADSDGSEIANGVYYLKFTARKGDKKIERIERLAKLK